ncbi:flagellar motor protein MotB [Helicobacter apodemus]|uniref:Flagellar motor protein MotB n=1 Tax=Helicobacter apodemus TaxID=135569 RepID=A0A4U8UDY4_9HELI|nr:flagellar motor protein MotB [Helicobacter apodemus]TLE14523.1 flagellar motor protein MotB [Helicobacter apodemus]
MAKRCPPCDCPNVLPLWLGTYGDMVTLILTFFILLLSMVTFDAKKLSEAEGSVDGALSLLSGGIKIEVDNTRIQQQADMVEDPETTEEVKKIESEILDFKENVKVSLGPSSIIDNGTEGFILRFHGKLLFKPDDYSVTSADEILFLKRLALILQKIPPNTHMDVIGYTDDRVVKPTAQYQDNLGLSALRAASVSRILMQNNVNPQKITALGGGANNFVFPNINEENRAINRRVEFRFYPDNRSLHKNQNILEKTIQQRESNIPTNNPNETL